MPRKRRYPATRGSANTLTERAEEVFDDVVAALPRPRIAKKYGVSVSTLDKWFSRDENKARYEEAKRASAHTLAEEGREILDSVDTQGSPTAAAANARDRAAFRRWLAGVRNREEYGEQQAEVNVAVTSGDLHFTLLQRLGNLDQVRKPAPPLITAEVVEDVDDDDDDLRDLLEA